MAQSVEADTAPSGRRRPRHVARGAVVVVAIVAVASAMWVFSRPPARIAATWALSDASALEPTSTSLSVDVWWAGCANGLAVVDPTPEVSYTPTTVVLTMWGIRPSGTAFSCQGNPRTTMTIQLSEPLGARAVVQGAATPH